MDDMHTNVSGTSDDDKTTLGNMFRFLGTLHQRCETHPESVMRFLSLTRAFQEGEIGLEALREQTERLFSNYPETLASFRRCFEGVDEDMGREGTPVQHEEMAVVHERKRHRGHGRTKGHRGHAPKMQKLDVHDALAFLDKIKLRYQSQPSVYNEFLEVMRQFKTQVMDTPAVVKRVGRMFVDEPDLIDDFNVFLPEGYEVRREGSNVVLCRL